MADIDFDELDKAVGDLMANVDASKRLPGLDEPEEKVVTIPASDTAPSVATPASPPTAQTTELPIATEMAPPSAAAPTDRSLAVKRRGQFMDIMHPSRDMNAPKPVNRQGTMIRPGNDIIAASAAGQNESSASAPASPEKQLAEASALTPSAWPDPIDMAPSAAEAPLSPASASETPVESIGEAPLTSPFLPDAKPEKRPLGGASQSEEAISTPETQTPAADTQTAPAVALPEEFSGDLMAVESRDLSSHPVQPATPTQAPVEQPKLEPGEEETLIPAVATPDPVEQPQTTQPPAGGSIAQQYTEQPSSGDQSNGSIYDTSAYHQAIEPGAPAKKKTPISVWIMVGVGLLLLGAIGGAAYFYFTR